MTATEKPSNSKPTPGVYFFLGHGGVGKTTLSALWAIQCAQSSLKTLILTLDPSKRLSTLFDLDPQSQEATLVEGEGLGDHLWAQCILPGEEMKNFLKESLGDSWETANKNKLFQQITDTMEYSQEFTSLYKITRTYSEYDVVILDTPPLQNSIEFLDAADRLRQFFEPLSQWDNSISSLWNQVFQSGPLSLIADKAKKPLMATVRKLLGEEFSESILGALQILNGLSGHFVQVLDEAEAILSSQNSSFFLVSRLGAGTEFQLEKTLMDFRDRPQKLEKAIFNEGLGSPLTSADQPLPSQTPPWLRNYANTQIEIHSQQQKLFQKLCDQHDKDVHLQTVPLFKEKPIGIDSLIKIANNTRL